MNKKITAALVVFAWVAELVLVFQVGPGTLTIAHNYELPLIFVGASVFRAGFALGDGRDRWGNLAEIEEARWMTKADS